MTVLEATAPTYQADSLAPSAHEIQVTTVFLLVMMIAVIAGVTAGSALMTIGAGLLTSAAIPALLITRMVRA